MLVGAFNFPSLTHLKIRWDIRFVITLPTLFNIAPNLTSLDADIPSEIWKVGENPPDFAKFSGNTKLKQLRIEFYDSTADDLESGPNSTEDNESEADSAPVIALLKASPRLISISLIYHDQSDPVYWSLITNLGELPDLRDLYWPWHSCMINEGVRWEIGHPDGRLPFPAMRRLVFDYNDPLSAVSVDISLQLTL